MTTDAPTGDLAAVRDWKDDLEEVVPLQGSWTEEEYLVLTSGRKRPVEYTDGNLEYLPWPTDQHQRMLGFLLKAFHDFIKPRGGTVHFIGIRLRIRRGKFRLPDLMLLVARDDPRHQNRFWEGADLVLEVVSEENPERDLVDKRADYAERRIPEYWIVNPLTQT
ncbi:MAG TPA: Uma2 family endonuclease, partial [Pirellulales bacterium]